MKKILSILLLAILALACTNQENAFNQPNDDDTDGNDGGPTGIVRFVADIEGTALNANQVDVQVLEIDNFDTIEITATNLDTDQRLTLRLPMDLETGAYGFDTATSLETVLGVFKPDTEGTLQFVSQSGTLTVTRINAMERRFDGNAVFTLANPTGDGVIEVTFCEFSVVY